MLVVNDLTKRFQLHVLGGKVIEGCRGISFEVAAGQFLALAGPSGAGKSTVLKCIYRTYLPTAGSIRYQSPGYGTVELAGASEQTILEIRRREIGYVSQFLRVIPRVSALEVVMQPLLLRGGADRESARARALELLDRLRIPPALFEAYPATFSGGEQQRINIARAVIWEPRLLLLDEPTASLDSISVSVVIEILRELRGRGTTLVGIFHDETMMQAVADRIIRIGGAAHA